MQTYSDIFIFIQTDSDIFIFIQTYSYSFRHIHIHIHHRHIHSDILLCQTYYFVRNITLSDILLCYITDILFFVRHITLSANDITHRYLSIGKIWLFKSRKIKHWHSKTSQSYIFKEIYLYNQTSIYKFFKLKLETAAVRANLHSLMVRFSFMRDCGSIPHGDSTASTFSSNFSTITSSKSTPRRRSYV